MKNYAHIFFDLDRTLWDFQTNSSEALRDILKEFSLDRHVSDEQEFIRNYNNINDRLWSDYRQSKIKKRELRWERFRLLLESYGLSDEKLIQDISRFYLNTAPLKTALIGDAKEVLKYLVQKYKLYIISNGFYDVQLTKVINSGISRYFTKVFTSDRIGYAKPKAGIFEYALSSANARKAESIMVGDDLRNDIQGARSFGIDTVYFNPSDKPGKEEANYTITNLNTLKEIL